MYSSLLDLIKDRFEGQEMKTYALASADDHNTIEAAMRAYEDGYAKPILIGDEDKIKAIMAELGKDYPEIEIIDEKGGMEATAKISVQLAREGRVSFIDKGLMDSSIILREMLKKDSGISTGKFVSVVTLFELWGYHKILFCSDMGLNMYPDLEGKKNILKNMIEAARDVGISCPKVAILCVVEKVNPKMPDTIDAAALKEMAENGEFGECIVEGPISYDLAIDAESARIKGFDSPVAGDADLLLFPDITSANMTIKALIRANAAHVAAAAYGLEVPLAFGSRSSSIAERYRTIAFTAALSK